MVLRNETLGAFIAANRELSPVYLRTWVGGDKDGHPGVNEVTLTQSLQAARSALVRWFEVGLGRVHTLSERIRDPELARQIQPIRKTLRSLRQIRPGDGGRVARLREQLKGLSDIHPAVGDLRMLMRVFPGLVVPLELRESSDLLMAAAKGKPLAISRMVKRVDQISRGGDPKWYARGLIISMASSMEHIEAAAQVVKRQMGAIRLPVIPLFEQNDALMQAPKIASGILADKRLREAMLKYWGRQPRSDGGLLGLRQGNGRAQEPAFDRALDSRAGSALSQGSAKDPVQAGVFSWLGRQYGPGRRIDRRADCLVAGERARYLQGDDPGRDDRAERGEPRDHAPAPGADRPARRRSRRQALRA